MMKRIICLLAALLMMGSWASAEGWFPDWQNAATPTPGPETTGGFRFRGGVTWEMNPEAVREKENGLQMEERSQESWSVLYSVNRVEASRFFADLVYIFYNQKLQMILYAFDKAESKNSYLYLTGAMSAVYGETHDAESAEVVGLMERVYPGMYTLEGISDVHAWQVSDGTRIYLYHQEGGSFSVLYAAPVTSLPENGVYITNGL